MTGRALAAVACLAALAAAQEPARPERASENERVERAPASAPGATAEPTRTLASYDPIRLRNPFSPKAPRKEEPPKPADPPKPAAEPAKPAKRVVVDNLHLTGILRAADGSGARVALVEEAGKAPRWLKPGDAFLGGTVAEVTFDTLVLTVADARREIRVGTRVADGTQTREEGAAPAPATTPAAGAAGGAAGKPELLTEDEKKLPAAERAKLLQERLRERAAKQRDGK